MKGCHFLPVPSGTRPQLRDHLSCGGPARHSPLHDRPSRHHPCAPTLTDPIVGASRFLCKGRLAPRRRTALLTLFLVVAGICIPVPGHTQDPRTSAAWRELLAGHQEDAVRIARQALRDHPQDPRAICVLIDALHKSGRDSEAVAFSRDLCRGSHSTSGPCLLAMGRAALLRQETAEAESLSNAALTRFAAEESEHGEIVVRGQIGTALVAQGRVRDATATLSTALNLAEKIQDPMEIICARLGFGRALSLGEKPEEAAVQFEHAAREAERLGVEGWKGDAEIQLSILHRRRMELDESLEHRRTALRAYEKAGDRSGQARSLHYIGAIEILKGDLPRATATMERAYRMAREASDIVETSGCLGDLAILSYLLGDLDRALEESSEAIRLGRGIRSGRWVGGILSNIGNIQNDQGRTEEALGSFDEALVLIREEEDRRTEATILNNIGRCLCQSGRPRPGLLRLDEAIERARAVRDPMTEAYALRDRGWCCLRLGDIDGAERAFLQADRIAQETGYFEIQESVLRGRAVAARSRGEREKSLQALEQAMATAEGVRARCAGASHVQAGYFAQGRVTYEYAVDLLYEMHRLAPDRGRDRYLDRSSGRATSRVSEAGFDRLAFDVAQRGKARSLLDLLSEVEVDLRIHADPDYQRHEKDLLEQLAQLVDTRPKGSAADSSAWETQIGDLERQIDVLGEEIRRADPRYAELRYPQPCTIDQVQHEVLEPEELLIEYLLGDSASYAWVVTPDEFRMVALPPRDQIREQVNRLLPILRDYNVTGRDPSYFIEESERTSRLVLPESILDLLREKKRVIIAPDGILHYLPFEVLLLGEGGAPPDGPSFDLLPYLALRADVSYAPSVSALARLRASRSADRGNGAPEVLLVGDPIPPGKGSMSVFARSVLGDDPPRLPHAEEEMRGIRTLFPAGRSTILRKGDATLKGIRRAFVADRYRYLHIAAHGAFNERRPQFSGLLLSAASHEGDDGFLTTGEVFGLEIPCDQVVLSACASALGEDVSGEGLVGLTRAFTYAGARSVVASLWEVSGEETSAFMREFYREIAKDGAADRAHALAETKRWMIRDTHRRNGRDPLRSHPFCWAAFVMTGDGR